MLLSRSEIDGGNDVGNALAPGNERGPLVHHAVPEDATLVIAGVPGLQERAAQARRERLHVLALNHRSAAIERCRL
jgi:hypothetical protein